MKEISQRTAKISIGLNIILTLISIMLFVFAVVQRIEADQRRSDAEMMRVMAEEQRAIAEMQMAKADSAAMIAFVERDNAMALIDSLHVLIQNQK